MHFRKQPDQVRSCRNCKYVRDHRCTDRTAIEARGTSVIKIPIDNCPFWTPDKSAKNRMELNHRNEMKKLTRSWEFWGLTIV